MGPPPISMNLRSISCKGIKSFNLFQKPSAYAVISVSDPSNPDGKQKKKHKTAADSDGGENPEWAESFQFDLGGGRVDLALEVDVMVQGNLLLLLPDRTVGRVNVPIADLLAEGNDGSARHVSYQVVGTDGKPNGAITFSYNFNFPAVSVPPGGGRPPPPCKLDPAVPSPAGTCYPPRDQEIPLPAGDYYPPPRQQSAVVPPPAGDYYPPPYQQCESAISSPAADSYPPPRQQNARVPSQAGDYYPPPQQQYESVISSPAADYYPPPPRQQYPVASSPSTECYPPPRQQEPVTAFPSADCCPPPRQQYPVVSSPASVYYPQPVLAFPAADSPPQRQQDWVTQTPAADYYPKPRQLYPTVSTPASDYYSAPRQQEPVVCYPPPGTEADYYAPPPVHVAYPPQPACCYPAPPQHDGYRQESWDHRLH